MKQLKMTIPSRVKDYRIAQGLTAHRSERTAEEYISDENDVQVCLNPLEPWDPVRL